MVYNIFDIQHKKNNMKKYFYLIIIALSFLLTCKNLQLKKEANLKEKCCRECLEAWSKSPAAIGQEGAFCGQFTTAEPICEECIEYFRKHPTTVKDCK